MFLVAASVKLWLVSDLAAFAFARRKLTPHRGGDLLGQTGIGRLFFSGIRIGLAPGAIPDAEPTVQITGLACPASAPDRVLKDSNLLATLREFQADNHTTQGLASIILAHAHWPYFLGIPGFVWVKQRREGLTVGGPAPFAAAPLVGAGKREKGHWSRCATSSCFPAIPLRLRSLPACSAPWPIAEIPGKYA